MEKILIIEDEAIIAMEMQSMLTQKGYEVVGVAENSQKALELVQAHHPDVVLTDINIKGNMDGTELAEKLYREYNSMIIFVTAYADNETLEKAKRSFPFGYIVKPFYLSQLYISIQLALENKKKQKFVAESTEKKNDTKTVDLGCGYLYLADQIKLVCDDREIKLTKNEHVLLKTLLENRKNYLSREYLEEKIWDGKEVGENTLRTLVYRLRNKLPVDLIEIQYGMGYRITL